ncbi:beta-lactamase family protein [Opitutia bacterium ISCC 51]|nr:beta-lactamase family protein [Opitutae bacterium ISCC 51]QXD27387.1 beta-lactamase family protein [Opitutae bacterium ISCC 52]
MKRFILLVLALAFGAFGSSSAQPMHTPTKMPMAKAESVGVSTGGLKRIDEVMQGHIEAGTIQGAITAVARRGKVVHFSTHGEMDVLKGREMERDAIFIMASSAKPVVGVAAMMLIEKGLISPSDPVSKYIPEFANMKVAVLADPTASMSKFKTQGKRKIPEHRLVPVETPMTIHHLLTHTSGLVSGGLGAKVGPVPRRKDDDTRASYTLRLAKTPLDFQPGTQWSYSAGAGLHVMSRIIEIASGTPFEEYVQKRIFDPLEMNHSYFRVPSDKQSKRVVIKGVDLSKKKEGWGVFSSTEDYLHFEQMLLNGGELFDHRLLSPASVKMMGSNQVNDLYATSNKKGQAGMGFGYTVAVTLDPDTAMNHRGKGASGWGGAAGTMSWTDPENELVAVIMLQQPRGSMRSDFAKAIYQAIIE